MKNRDLIEKHLHHDNQFALRSSAQNYAETGKVSGTLLIAIERLIEESKLSDESGPEKQDIDICTKTKDFGMDHENCITCGGKLTPLLAKKDLRIAELEKELESFRKRWD